MVVEIRETRDQPGIELYDPVQQRRVYLSTDARGSLQAVDPDTFCFPLDEACAVETTTTISFDTRYQIDVHDADGQTIRSVDAGQCVDFDGHTQFLGISGPMKVYVRIDEPGRLETGIDSVRIEFDEPATVEVGARSVHERPAATIETPDDPASMMTAVSALSSALKTTSPERSWPTLRGYPPLIERGPELSIPSVVEPAETGVRIEIPPTHAALYAVAPLAYYLGATVTEGETAAIETEYGRHELGEAHRLEDDVARALKRTFLLDCVVRTEGLYRYQLHERSELEPHLPFDIAETYDASLPARLERYFTVDYETLEPYVPRWPLTAHVPPTPDGVEIIPHVVNELGLVREPRGSTAEMSPGSSDTATAAAGDREFVRSVAPTRGSTTPSGESDGPTRFVDPAVTDESVEHAWFGTDVPIGASKATIEAYRNQIDRGRPGSEIEILVVCNEARMLDEHDSIDGTYGSRDQLPFDVHSEFGVSTADLANLLTDGGYDFLHFIGHATPDGLQCPDGELDVRSLETVDLGVFFLNACRSYEQALALTRRGAFGGVGTVGDVVNTGAVAAGETMARLLNLGFPLRAAVELVKDRTLIGDQYLVVGDGSTDIAQFDGGGPPLIATLESTGEQYRYSLDVYPTTEYEIGTAFSPTISDDEIRYLTPGEIGSYLVDAGRLEQHLLWTSYPLVVDGTISWNDGFGVVDLPD